jgi:hypothetical protein
MICTDKLRNIHRWITGKWFVIMIFCFQLLSLKTVHAQTMSVNTDLLMDVLQTPSLGLEFVTGNSTTVGVNAMMNNKPWGKDIKLFMVQPELRYYFSRRAMHHHFVGFCVPIGTYRIEGEEKVYDGYGVGVGITFGYVMSLASHWTLDFHAGVQNFFYKQKEYYQGDPYDERYIRDGQHTTNARGTYFLPTRIGVSIGYLF